MDDPAHRRIELQSPEDLTYLIDNVRRAAADSINAAFPPVDNPLDGQEDELRNHIEQLVNDVRLVLPSIRDAIDSCGMLTNICPLKPSTSFEHSPLPLLLSRSTDFPLPTPPPSSPRSPRRMANNTPPPKPNRKSDMNTNLSTGANGTAWNN